jgi:hypothetical protein
MLATSLLPKFFKRKKLCFFLTNFILKKLRNQNIYNVLEIKN